MPHHTSDVDPSRGGDNNNYYHPPLVKLFTSIACGLCNIANKILVSPQFKQSIMRKHKNPICQEIFFFFTDSVNKLLIWTALSVFLFHILQSTLITRRLSINTFSVYLKDLIWKIAAINFNH